VFTLVFFVLLYAMHQGFDPRPFLSEVSPSYAASSTSVVSATSTRPIATTSSATVTPVSVAKASSSKSIQTATKSAPTPVKKPAKAATVVVTPEPLLVEKGAGTSSEPGTPSSEGALNQQAILAIVNKERAAAGLSPLGFNVRLSAMAEGKAVDMINKQYFAHVSPTGVDVASLAGTYRYDYIYLGENLALGDFESSQDVMTGWMNSPGHRANILSPNYTEIGIAALKGNYKGRVVWYAVQEFGKPLSACSTPDRSLEATIVSEEASGKSMESELETLRATIEATDDRSTYNQLVTRYNAMVDEYNALVADTKKNIARYNDMVTAFNVCVGSTGTH
jgi:uncharacterized protein YkwD